MVKKKKFRPVITRVKLNPEQAVLSCDCFDSSDKWTGFDSDFFSSSGSCDFGKSFCSGYYTSSSSYS